MEQFVRRPSLCLHSLFLLYMEYINEGDFMRKRPKISYHSVLQISGIGGSLSGSVDARRSINGVTRCPCKSNQ